MRGTEHLLVKVVVLEGGLVCEGERVREGREQESVRVGQDDVVVPREVVRRQQKSDAEHFVPLVDAGENHGCALLVHLPSCCLKIQQGHPQQQNGREVGDQESSTTILIHQIGESPEGTETHGESNERENILVIAVVVVVIGGATLLRCAH